jgi:hypothetical protein
LAIRRRKVMMTPVTGLSWLIAWFRRAPKSSEDVAAEREAGRIRDDITTTRWSTRAPGGEFYEAERRRSEE